MANNDTVAALREIRSVIIPACEFQSGAKVTPDFDEPYAAKRAREAVRLIDNLITQLEQAEQGVDLERGAKAIQKVIEDVERGFVSGGDDETAEYIDAARACYEANNIKVKE